MKKWMIADSGENYILLHYNEELEQYDRLPRVPKFVVWLLKLTQRRT